MKEYQDLVRHVIENGSRKQNRTGVDTLCSFGYHYKVDLSKGFPLLTTKKIYFKSVIRELLWYLSGETHIRNLREHTKIWDDWTSEENNWEIGRMYGYQWIKWEKYEEKGLVMIGIPSNDFGQQEPGSSEEIKNFCEAKFGITFPMTEKVSVKGDNAHPFYLWAKKNFGNEAVPKWNFHKIIINKEGKVETTFASIISPSSKKFVSAIEKNLNK